MSRTGSSTWKTGKKAPPSPEQCLREALAPYLNLRRLRHLAAYDRGALREALLTDTPPPEVQAMLDVLSVVLSPRPVERIANPAEVAALLLVEMSHLSQEQLRVICLNTKGHVQTIQTVYQGSLSVMVVRPMELFREAIRRNSAGVILAHNHPSGDVAPSLEDLALTRQAIGVGRLLGVEVVDHVIIGSGQWFSMRMETTIFEDDSPDEAEG
jgi:hypothetical protein